MSNNNTVTIIIPVIDWAYELTNLYNSYFPNSQENFRFEDFVEIAGSVVNLATSSVGESSNIYYEYLQSLLTKYIDPAMVHDLIKRYVLYIKKALEKSKVPIFPSMELNCTHWITSEHEIYINYNKQSNYMTNPLDYYSDMSRDDVMKSIERGDYVNERIRQRYGV